MKFHQIDKLNTIGPLALAWFKL